MKLPTSHPVSILLINFHSQTSAIFWIFVSGHNFIYMWPENTFKKPEILEKNTKNLVDAKYNRLKIGWPLRPVRPKARPSHDILRPPWDSWDKITYQKHRLSFRFFGQIRLTVHSLSEYIKPYFLPFHSFLDKGQVRIIKGSMLMKTKRVELALNLCWKRTLKQKCEFILAGLSLSVLETLLHAIELRPCIEAWKK